MDSPVLSVAAYVFEEDQYHRLRAGWHDVLAEYSLPYFHMVDCAHGRGVFKHLTPQQRDQVARRMIGHIKLRMRIGLVCSISERDLHETKSNDFILTPYSWIIQWLIGGVANWAERFNCSDKIVYLFERGHDSASQMNEAMAALGGRNELRQWTRYGGHDFRKKDDLSFGAGLQAADILAWEWNRDRINALEGFPRRRRRSLESLLESPHLSSHFTRESLEEIFRMRPQIMRDFVDMLRHRQRG